MATPPLTLSDAQRSQYGRPIGSQTLALPQAYASKKISVNDGFVAAQKKLVALPGDSEASTRGMTANEAEVAQQVKDAKDPAGATIRHAIEKHTKKMQQEAKDERKKELMSDG